LIQKKSETKIPFEDVLIKSKEELEMMIKVIDNKRETIKMWWALLTSILTVLVLSLPLTLVVNDIEEQLLNEILLFMLFAIPVLFLSITEFIFQFMELNKKKESLYGLFLYSNAGNDVKLRLKRVIEIIHNKSPSLERKLKVHGFYKSHKYRYWILLLIGIGLNISFLLSGMRINVTSILFLSGINAIFISIFQYVIYKAYVKVILGTEILN
jgi:hypothetical protein